MNRHLSLPVGSSNDHNGIRQQRYWQNSARWLSFPWYCDTLNQCLAYERIRIDPERSGDPSERQSRFYVFQKRLESWSERAMPRLTERTVGITCQTVTITARTAEATMQYAAITNLLIATDHRRTEMPDSAIEALNGEYGAPVCVWFAANQQLMNWIRFIQSDRTSASDAIDQHAALRVRYLEWCQFIILRKPFMQPEEGAS